MKKFLSLVLALVMTMSLVTVSAGAKDFTDSTKIQYAEAVDVMSAVKVIDGYAEGDFRPSTTLTRGAAAKIICNLILGPTTASALVADAAPYKDVPTNHTFAGYIAYCQKTGIISGYADGSFKPANSLTGYAFMKMLLGALGYKAEQEGYTGANWSIQVAKRALNIGLADDLVGDFNGVKAVTREEACLYAFNTLKATMVEYENDSSITVNGVTFTNKSTAKEMANTAKVETIKDDNKMQFAEKYFDKLVKKDTTDDFGRPSAEWTYDKNKVGTYVDYTTLVQEFTTKVTYKDLYDTIGSSNLKNNDFKAYVDGVDQKTNVSTWSKTDKSTAYETGNGVLTQVFVDTDKDLVTVAVINTYLAKATADYSTKNDKVTLNVYGIKKATGSDEFVKDVDNEKVSFPVYGEDVAAAEDLKKDDFVLVTVAAKEVQTIAPVETVSKTSITNFSKKDYLTAGGTKYEYSDGASYDKDVLKQYTYGAVANLKDKTYNLFLDAYGYVIGVEIVDDVKNYVFITGYESFKNVLSNAKTDANAIFVDGTSKTITVNVDEDLKQVGANNALANWAAAGNATLNKWYTYTEKKDGTYDLELVATDNSGKDENQGHDLGANNKEINKSHVSLKGDGAAIAYGNENTVYLKAKVKHINNGDQITKAESVTTGVKNANFKLETGSNNDPQGAYYLYNDDNYIIAAVVVAKNAVSSDNYVFITDEANYEGYDSAADEYTWTAEGIRNGEKITLTEVGDKLTYLRGLDTDSFYKVSYDSKGYVIEAPEKIDNAKWDNIGGLDGDTYAVDGVKDFNHTATGYDKEDVELVRQEMNPNYGTKLVMKGHTLYVKNANDPSSALDYALDVAPDAKAVLKDRHDLKWETEYFNADSGNVKAAIDEMDNANYTGWMYAVMKDGVVTSVIIVDTENHPGTGVNGKPSTASEVASVTLAADGNVSLYDNKGAAITTTGVKRDAELYRYSAGQNGHVCVFTGTYVWGEQNPWTLKTGDSYYVVIDGVRSNTVIAK